MEIWQRSWRGMAGREFRGRNGTMVKITESEFRYIDGSIRKVRRIEAAYARIERSDGTVEEFSDCMAEGRFSPDSPSLVEWRVFGIPVPTVKLLGPDDVIVLLAENAEPLVKIVGILAGVTASREGGISFVGTEAPL